MLILTTGVVSLGACGSGSGVCADFDDPKRNLATECAAANPEDPTALVACLRGGGHAGTWAVDRHGLPAFDFGIEQRCDSVATVESSSGETQSDPVHLIGNGRGTVALAHASGAVEILRQDRGSGWLNKSDAWRDPNAKNFPVQLGGGFNYIVIGDSVQSTRYNDFSVSKALGTQTRRFGVGYYETVTTLKDVRVTRRVFAADTNARALVAEVTLENLSNANKEVGLVEFWDLNLHPILAEPVTNAGGDESVGEARLRRRRAASGLFSHTLHYSSESQVAIAESRANELPGGVVDRASSAELDYFPSDIFLATVDQAAGPDSVWLSDDELWDPGDTERGIPDRAAEDGSSAPRSLEVDGAEQGGILALRVPVVLPTGGTVTRRFAIGYATEDVDVESAVDELRANQGELLNTTATGWKERLAWMAVDATDGGVMQRELAWSSYYVQAQATYDELRGVRAVGVGGATQYLAGMLGNASNLAQNAEGLIHLNPGLARETLLSAMSSQHSSQSETPYRFPASRTGVDSFSDGEGNTQRSDSYIFVPTAVGRYIALTRDTEFLTAKSRFWPVAVVEQAEVRVHLARSLEYLDQNIGFGAQGLVALGTDDFGGDLLRSAMDSEFPLESSSVLNAAAIVHGFPLLAEVLAAAEDESADAYAAILMSQASALESGGWNGSYYERAVSESGDPLVPGVAFAATQALPVLAGLADIDRRDSLLDALEADGSHIYVDGPRRPAIAAWVTEALALRDPNAAWENLLAQSMASGADADPDHVYGVWTGPGSFEGSTSDAPNAASRLGPRPDADFPYVSTEAHMATVRASLSLLGISANPRGWRIKPKLPSETFSVVLPNLTLRGTPNSIGGSITAQADELIEVVVTLPSGARESEVVVTVKAAQVEFLRGPNNTVSFPVPVRAGEPVPFSVSGL
tara:strand:+ start:25027 stop:27792 length:2766 start_codon:yes stop_codon:yes gene_type:complete